jgi:hypothetical protein
LFVRKKTYQRDIAAWESYAAACRIKLTLAERDCPGPKRELSDLLVEACRPLPVVLGLTHADPSAPVPPPRDDLLREISDLVSRMDEAQPNMARALAGLGVRPDIEAS